MRRGDISDAMVSYAMLLPKRINLCTPDDFPPYKFNDGPFSFIPTKEHPLLPVTPHHPSQFIRIIQNQLEILHCSEVAEEIPWRCFQAILLHLP